MSQFVSNMLWVSVVCGTFIFCIWVLSPFLNKHFTAKWKYWLWLLIAIRLILPFNFGLPQFSAPAVLSQVISIQNMSVAALIAPIPFVPQTDATEAITYPAYSFIAQLALYQVLFIIWLTGSILFAAIQLARYFAVKRKILRWSVIAKGQETAEILLNLSKEMGINATIYLQVNKEISSPLIMGLIRPVLILPHEDYEHNDLTLILRHELTHYKNKDIFYKVTLFIANAIHWFNPLVYLMVQESHADMERVCDDDVLQNGSAEERREYSEVILNSIGQNKMRGSVFTTNFYTGTNKIKVRFSNIMDLRKKKQGLIQLLVVAFLVVVVSSINPVPGYAAPRGAGVLPADSAPVHSYTFTTMMFDAANIDVLDIHLPYGNLIIAKNYEIAPNTQIFISGTTLGNVLTISPTTRTAYIQNNPNLPEGFGYYEEAILFIIVSGEPAWAFEQANIYLENGNIGYIHTHINEFLAENLHVHLPQGSIINQAPQTNRVLIIPQ
ncbi:MAG: M56 family metallopeptidase [Defluviitaleaceae bacterium]|nr:M56 family metallopeptidase [Defluviitaleaceae bacterium]MCL2275521.1 M56 family metallopeptidase [Defluviitaleaceae bacterium]